MKRLILFIIALSLPAFGGSLPLQEEAEFYDQPQPASTSLPWTFLNSASGASVNANDVTATIDATGSSALFAWVATAGTTYTLTNTSGGTWTKMVQGTDGSSSYISIWKNTTATNASEVVGVAGSFIYPTIILRTFSGGNGCIVDQTNSATGSGSTPDIQPGLITPGADNELILAGMISHTLTSSLTVDGGFSTPVTNGTIFSVFTGGSHLVQTSAAASNPKFTKNQADFLGAAQVSVK